MVSARLGQQEGEKWRETENDHMFIDYRCSYSANRLVIVHLAYGPSGPFSTARPNTQSRSDWILLRERRP